MNDCPVHPIENLFENPFPGQDRADRHMSAGQRLGEQYHVGLDAPVLDGKKTAGPPEPGLDFVSNEQGAELSTQIERAAKIVIVRNDDAFALDRLDDECCDFLRG